MINKYITITKYISGDILMVANIKEWMDQISEGGNEY